MDHREAGRYWESNAAAWTELSRAGYDTYRDALNTPAFMALLPDVTGRRGLDIGCGEGHNTRQVADRGASMTGLDVSPTFLAAARDEEARNPRGITYLHANAVELPFPDAAFDFATAFMSLMDIPDQPGVLAEAARVVRPGGFLQFSIEHPFNTVSHREWIRDECGTKQALAVAGYFEQEEMYGAVETWLFSTVPEDRRAEFRPFQVPRFRRTVSGWINAVAGAGFSIEAADEPCPDDATLREHPRMGGARLVPLFLHLRCRKPHKTQSR